jgi:prepilin peptidase CpaA
MLGAFAHILLGALALLLLAAAWGDIRTRTIPNALNAAIALLAIPWWWANGWALWPDIMLQIGVAAILFGLFAIAFAMGAMGGGDVKLIAALALWLKLVPLAQMLVVMALAGGVLTLFLLARHRWLKAEGRPEIPYGVAIVAAGFWVVANDVLTISGS